MEIRIENLVEDDPFYNSAECTLISTHSYPYDVPLSERFLAELRCTDKGTPSVPNLLHQVVTTNANVNYISIYKLLCCK